VSARTRRLAAVALAASLLVAAPLTLTGCSMVEGIIETQTGGDIDLGGNTVPDDFPADVPLADGDIVNGSAIASDGGEKVWNVLINVADPSAPDSIAAQLEGAGFTSPGVGDVTDEGGTLQYVKDDLVVNVLLAKSGDGWTGNYTVAKSAS
jgi:predicted small secreted protein